MSKQETYWDSWTHSSNVLPVAEPGFHLHKGFHEALCRRYGWNLSNIPPTCNCGTSFSVDHAMTCHMGGISTIRHNEICDITATMLTEICHNFSTEPPLQPLSSESFAIAQPFFDVRVFQSGWVCSPRQCQQRYWTTVGRWCHRLEQWVAGRPSVCVHG